MNKLTALPLILLLATGCGHAATTYVHSQDTTLGRVVVYRNGVAYFERTADVQGDHLDLKVPADKVDDFLKSLTVVDAKTGQPAPITYPTRQATGPNADIIDMKIGLTGPTSHRLKLSYVTEAPSWKPSYRVVLGEGGKVDLQAWAIVDNTSGEDWKDVRLGVGSSSALSFRFDLQSVRLVERETLQQNDLFALAPPTGGATYGVTEKKLIADVDDSKLLEDHGDHDGVGDSLGLASGGHGAGAARIVARTAPVQAAPPSAPKDQELERLAQSVQGMSSTVIIEGFAKPSDGDKQGASLERANKMREQLLRNGVAPNKVVAVGRGEQIGHSGGVRLIEAPADAFAFQKRAEPPTSSPAPLPLSRAARRRWCPSCTARPTATSSTSTTRRARAATRSSPSAAFV
jgi:hypothetical protein